ncbi:MAG: CBS domain-containing protein [Pirellulales bacterium]
MTQVRDIMSKCAVTVRPETTLAEAAQLLAGHHVDGAPVVTADRTLVGMISERQLLDILFDVAVRSAPVSEYMATDVQSVEPNESLVQVAQLLALYSFRRIPVAEHGKLLGVVTRRDLMGYTLRTGSVLVDPLAELIPSVGQFA